MSSGTHWLNAYRFRVLLWAGAALVAVALHVAAPVALVEWPQPSEADIAGAIAIEVAPMAMGGAELTELPPGPETNFTPEATKQTPKRAPMDMSPVAPSPLATHPEVSVPLPLEKDKPKEKEDTAATSHETPTTAPPSGVNPSQASAALILGLSPAAARARGNWEKALASHINLYQHYPAGAQTHHVHGQVTVQFTVDRGGKIVASRVIHGSGSLLLDEEAIAMLRRAVPLPVPPAEAQGATFDFVLPIRFQIK